MAWTIYARTPLLRRHGELDYDLFDATVRFCAVGTWKIVLDARSPLAAQMMLPGWGIEVVDDDGRPVTSGPVDKFSRVKRDRSDLLTLFGSDDTTFLAERLVHPQPATATPPYNTSEYDVRTGVCSTVLHAYVDANAGAGALGPRRVVGLTEDADPGVGNDVTGRGRWQNLLEFLQGLAVAGGGIGFRVRQVDNELRFQTYQPEDRSTTVRFGPDKGNVSAYSHSSSKPTATYVYAAGGGEGTARTIREGQDSTTIARWGRRVEVLRDRRDTTDTDELDQEIAKQLTEGRGETSMSIDPIDIEGTTYLVDYDLGDIVTGVVDGTTVITDVIREVKIIIGPTGRIIRPVIGTTGVRQAPRILRQWKQIRARVADLERR